MKTRLRRSRMEKTMKTRTVDQHAEAIEFRPATSSHVLSFRGLRAVCRIALPAAILLLAISTCAATNAGAQAAAPTSQSPSASQKVTQILIPASLTASVDAKKKKPGELVRALLSEMAKAHLSSWKREIASSSKPGRLQTRKRKKVAR